MSDKGWSAQYGARPLKRTIQKYVEDFLSEEIINDKIHSGDNISLDYDEKREVLYIKEYQKKTRKSKK